MDRYPSQEAVLCGKKHFLYLRKGNSQEKLRPPVSRASLKTSQILFYIFKDLFIYERERERGRDTGRGRRRLLAGVLDPRITT